MSPRVIRRAAMVAAAVVMATVSAAYASGTGTEAHARSAAYRSHASTSLKYSVSFSPNHPKTSSSLTLSLSAPQQPETASFVLPTGVALNLHSVPVCAAPPKCSPATQVGTGSASVKYKQYTIPLAFGIFNGTGGVTVVIEVTGGTPVIISPTWTGTTLTVPYPNGTYKGEPIVTTSISLTFNQLGKGGNAFVRTPSSCPRSGWKSSADLIFSTGTTSSLNAAAKCSVAKKKKKKRKH